MQSDAHGSVTTSTEMPVVICAIFVGLLAGLLAVLSWGGTIAHWFGPSRYGVVIPLALLLLALITGISIFVAGIHRAMWHRRMYLALVAALFCTHLTGIRLGPLSPFHFALTLLFGLWVLDYLMHPTRVFYLSTFSSLVLLFFGCMLWSVLGKGPAVLLGGVPSLDTVLFAFLLVDVLRSHEMVRYAVRALIWTALIFSIVGIVQVLLAYFFGIELTLASESMRYAYTPFGRSLRASAFKMTPNALGDLAAPASVLALALSASSTGKRNRGKLVLSAIVMWIAVALSFGRASWISLAVGLLALPFVSQIGRVRFKILFASLLLVGGLATMAAPGMWKTALEFGGGASVEIRTTLLATGIQVAAEHPWNGVGVDNFGERYSPVERWHVHNAAVQLASELGLPGLLVFLIVLGRALFRLVLATRIAPTTELRDDSRSLLAGLVPLLVFIQAEGGGYSEFLWTYLALSEVCTRLALTRGSSSIALAIAPKSPGNPKNQTFL